MPEFPSFLRLNNILSYACTTFCLSIHLCRILGLLLPPDCCEWSCYKHGCTKISLRSYFQFSWWTEVKWSESRSVMSDCLQPHGLYSEWNSLGHNTGVGSLSFLQGIFPTQRLNPGLPHCRWILYQLSPKGNPFFWYIFRNGIAGSYIMLFKNFWETCFPQPLYQIFTNSSQAFQILQILTKTCYILF